MFLTPLLIFGNRKDRAMHGWWGLYANRDGKIWAHTYARITAAVHTRAWYPARCAFGSMEPHLALAYLLSSRDGGTGFVAGRKFVRHISIG